MKTLTFHVSLPGTGRTWRKLELRADQTLEDLHFAIQDAFEWDADHMYSFFMSGKAWDTATEYAGPDVPPEDAWLLEDGETDAGADSEGADEEDEFDIEDEDDLGDETPPTPDQLRLFLAMIKGMSSEEQQKLVASFQQETGIPALFTDMFLSFVRSADDPAMLAPLFDASLDLGMAEPGAAATTTLDSLALKKGQKFLYLFDYGDEWRFAVKVHAINPAAPEDRDYPVLVEAMGEAPSQYPGWDEEDEASDEEEE